MYTAEKDLGPGVEPGKLEAESEAEAEAEAEAEVGVEALRGNQRPQTLPRGIC